MLGTGVQDISIDIKGSKSSNRDVDDRIENLVRQSRHLDQWENGSLSGKRLQYCSISSSAVMRAQHAGEAML